MATTADLPAKDPTKKPTPDVTEAPDHTAAAARDSKLQEKSGPDALKKQREVAARPLDAKTEAQLPPVQLTAPLERSIATKVQNDMLLEFAADYTPKTGGDQKQQQELVEARQKKLQEERDNHVWGPESQRAMKDYVKWVQESAIPATMQELKSNGLPMPPGYPAKIPTGPDGKVVSAEDYAKQIASGAAQVDLKVYTGDRPHAPTALDLNRLLQASDWTNRARADITKKEGDSLFEFDKKKIGNELPQTWQLEKGQDPAQYRSALRVGSDLYEKLGTAAMAVYSLRKMGDSSLELPPGIKVEDDGHGHLTPKIDLSPKLGDLLSDPRTKNYLEWYDKATPRIQQDTGNLQLAQKNPYNNLLYGNVDLPGARDKDGQWVSKQAVLDSNGRLVSVYDPMKEKAPEPPKGPDGKPTDQYHTENVDLIQQRFTAQRVNPKDRNSDITVDISVQAQQGRPFTYDLLNKDIGQPLLMERRTYKADDMVLYNGKLVQARTLPDRLAEDQALYAGGKAFNIALDASMLLGGAGTIAKFAKAGVTGITLAASELAEAEAGAKVTAGMTRMALYRGFGETLAGAGGIIANNAWGHDYVPWVDEARAPYFIGTGAAGVSSRFQSYLSGGEAVAKALKDYGPAYLQVMSNVSEKTMSGLMPIMAGQIATSVGSHYYNMFKNAGHENDPSPLALSMLAASRLPEHTILGPNGKDNPNGGTDATTLTKLANNYEDVFKSDGPAGKDAQEILATAGKWDKLSDAEKKAAISQWSANLTFNAEEIKQLDAANNGKLTDQEIQDLMDPQKRSVMKESVRTTAEALLASRNSDRFPEISQLQGQLGTPYLDDYTANQLQQGIDRLRQEQATMNADTQMASRMALLMTATSLDGKLPATLGSTHEHVDRHTVTEWGYLVGHQIPQPAGVPPRDVSENITSQSVLNGLRADLSTHGADGKTLALTDVLVRTGALPPQQFSSIIQEKLRNGTPEEKMQLLSSTEGPLAATVLDSLYQSQVRMQDPTLTRDERSALQAANFGNSYKDLMGQLSQTAAHDPNETVRAMALASYAGVRQLSSNLDQTLGANQILAAYRKEREQIIDPADDPRRAADLDKEIARQQEVVAKDQAERQKIIDRMKSELESAKTGQPGHRMDAIKEALGQDLQTPLPPGDAAAEIEKRMNAAMALSTVTPTDQSGASTRQRIDSSLAEAFARSERSQSLYMIDTLPPEMLQRLSGDSRFGQHLLDLVPTPDQSMSDDNRQDAVKLLGRISQFAKDAPKEFKSGLEDKLDKLIGARSRISLALPYVQAAAVQTASTLNAQGNLTSIEKLASDVGGSSSISREAAIKALGDMQDPALKSMLPDLLSNETDQQLHKELLELQDRVNGKTGGTDRAGDVAARRLVEASEIQQSYPAVGNFDRAAQQKFLEQSHLSLLDHDLFVKEAQLRVQQNWGTNQMNKESPDMTMAGLFKERQEQFKQLLQLSQGDVSDPQTQMARAYLAEVAGNGGKPITSDESKYLVGVNRESGHPQPYYYDETHYIWPMIDQFDVDAAKTLGKIAKVGENGFDLNSHLVGNLLSSPGNVSTSGLIALADSWKTMYESDPGHTVISSDRYQYALARALDVEKQRQVTLQQQIAQAQAMRASRKSEVTPIETRKKVLKLEQERLTELEQKLTTMLGSMQ